MLDKTEIAKFERLRLIIDKVVKSRQDSQGKSISPSTAPSKNEIKSMNEAVLTLKEMKFAFIKNNVSFSNDEFILNKQEQIKAVKEKIDSIIENVIPHTWLTPYDIFNNKQVELTELNIYFDEISKHIADIKERKNKIIEESKAKNNLSVEFGNSIAETLNPASTEREQVLKDNGSSEIPEVNEAHTTVPSPSTDPLIPSVKPKKKTRTPSIDIPGTHEVSTDTYEEKIKISSKQIEGFKKYFATEIKFNENFRTDKFYNNIYNKLSNIRNNVLNLINDPECNDLENIINKRKGNGKCTDDKEVELLIKYLTPYNKTYQLKDGLEAITLDKLHAMQSDKDKNKQVIRILQQTFTINELLAILSEKKEQVVKKIEDDVALYDESKKKIEMRENEFSGKQNEKLKDSLIACKDRYKNKSTLLKQLLTEAECMIKFLPNAEMEPALADKLKSYQELLNQNRTLTKKLTENIDRINKQYKSGESLESDFLKEKIRYYEETESALDKHLSETKLIVSQLKNTITAKKANLLKDYSEAVAKHQQEIANYKKIYSEINKFCKLGETETNNVKFEEINEKSINTVNGHTQQMSADNSINFLDENLRQAKDDFKNIELEMTTLLNDIIFKINGDISTVFNEFKKKYEYMDEDFEKNLRNLDKELSLNNMPIFDESTHHDKIYLIRNKLAIIYSRIVEIKIKIIKIDARKTSNEVNAINELIEKINSEITKLSQDDPRIPLLNKMKNDFNELIVRYTRLEIKNKTDFVQESLNIFQNTMSDDQLIKLTSEVQNPLLVFFRNLLTSFLNKVSKIKSQSLLFATDTEIKIRNQAGHIKKDKWRDR
jgi:hypothetical protein